MMDSFVLLMLNRFMVHGQVVLLLQCKYRLKKPVENGLKEDNVCFLLLVIMH